VHTKRVLAGVVLAALFVAMLPVPVDAQRRAVVRRVSPRAVIVGAGSPFFYDPWFRYPFGWYGAGMYGAGWGGWGGWGGFGPGAWYGPGGWGAQYAYNTGSVRLQVTPKTAEVFVDGYYAGTVDQFDGTFQRLRVEAGEHEIALYADGFNTLSQRLYVQPSATVTIRQGLEALQPGDVQPPRPSPASSAASATTVTRSPGGVRPLPRQPRARTRVDTQTPPAPVESQADSTSAPNRADATFGVISVRVQPSGADVVIDGERWEGPGDDERLLVQLSPGPHQVEVRRDGYRTFSRSVEIRRGETETLNISLSRQ